MADPLLRRPLVRVSCGLLAAAVLAACSSAGGGSASGAGAPGSQDEGTAGSQHSTEPPTSPRSRAASSTPEGTQRAAGTDWGPARAQVRRARRAVARMSLWEKAGQVLVARYAGTAAPTALVRRHHLAGVIVMGDNLASGASVDAVRRSNAALQRADERDWPLFLAVDQEGGIVNRLNAPMTRFPTMMTYGAAGRRGLARASARASGEELRAAGFTVVFAPDADVTLGAADPTIGSRSVGSRPRQVARMVTAAVRGYRDAGIVPVVKHFPGHGSVTTDSHLALPVQRASMRTLRRRDLRPCAAAIAAGAPAAMVGHLDVRAVDPRTPATLSRPVVTGLLRRRMGFEGVVVTDAMEMGAIVDGYGTADATVRALRAGVDTVLMPADLPAAHRAIVRAVRSGRLAEKRLTQAATRTVALLMHQGAQGRRPGPHVIGSHAGVSHRASRAAVTVVKGRCTGRLVGPAVSVSGDPEAVRTFRAVARRRGLPLAASGTSVVLRGYGDSAASGDVVVATDTPYVLGDSRARTKIAAYGQTPGALRALVDVLLGRSPAPGTLPVRVDGVPRRGC